MNLSFAGPKKPSNVFCAPKWMCWSWATSSSANPSPQGCRSERSLEHRLQSVGFRPCRAQNPQTEVCAPFPDETVHILLVNEYFPPDTSATAKFIAPVA